MEITNNTDNTSEMGILLNAIEINNNTDNTSEIGILLKAIEIVTQYPIENNKNIPLLVPEDVSFYITGDSMQQYIDFLCLNINMKAPISYTYPMTYSNVCGENNGLIQFVYPKQLYENKLINYVFAVLNYKLALLRHATLSEIGYYRLDIDFTEVSWAIQMNIFTMHCSGNSIATTNKNGFTCIDKRKLLGYIHITLTHSRLSKRNAEHIFKNMISTCLDIV
jgi:hypothetical protein